MKNAVAIIPARGGSKRIPRKNIKEFCGKPIIAYSIETALKSGLFEQVIVSTDDKEIADVARSYGAHVPFMRPKALSDDISGTSVVLLHALEWLKENDKVYDYACCIYATAPFLQAKYIRQGYSIVLNGSSFAALSVTTYPYSIFRSLKECEGGYVDMIWPEYRDVRSQDMPEAYHDAGQFYWVNCNNYLVEKKLLGEKMKAVLLPRYFVQDIDTEEDWIQAELMFSALHCPED